MSPAEAEELGRVADELEHSARRLPLDSEWRDRFVREARMLRSVACLPLLRPVPDIDSEAC